MDDAQFYETALRTVGEIAEEAQQREAATEREHYARCLVALARIEGMVRNVVPRLVILTPPSDPAQTDLPF